MPDAEMGTTPEADKVLKWGVRHRLEFIEFRLYWNGRLGRRDVIDRFNISAQQATTDLERYMQIAPDNMRYDPVLRTYLRTEAYRPRLIGGNADRYLLQMQAIRLGWLDREQTYFDELPPMEVVELRHAPLSDDVLRSVLDSIRLGRSMNVEYWTMSGKPARARTIAPHALAFSAGRWHARAWNAENGDFRDFNLSRMGQVVLSKSSPVNPRMDLEWHTSARMRLLPNPDLSVENQDAVRREYGFEGEELVVTIRLALLFYVIAQHNLDVDGVRAEQKRLVLLNADELHELRGAARRMSAAALEEAGHGGLSA